MELSMETLGPARKYADLLDQLYEHIAAGSGDGDAAFDRFEQVSESKIDGRHV